MITPLQPLSSSSFSKLIANSVKKSRLRLLTGGLWNCIRATPVRILNYITKIKNFGNDFLINVKLQCSKPIINAHYVLSFLPLLLSRSTLIFEDDEYLFEDTKDCRAQVLPWLQFPDSSDTNPAEIYYLIFYICKTKSQSIFAVHIWLLVTPL